MFQGPISTTHPPAYPSPSIPHSFLPPSTSIALCVHLSCSPSPKRRRPRPHPRSQPARHSFLSPHHPRLRALRIGSAAPNPRHPIPPPLVFNKQIVSNGNLSDRTPLLARDWSRGTCMRACDFRRLRSCAAAVPDPDRDRGWPHGARIDIVIQSRIPCNYDHHMHLPQGDRNLIQLHRPCWECDSSRLGIRTRAPRGGAWQARRSSVVRVAAAATAVGRMEVTPEVQVEETLVQVQCGRSLLSLVSSRLAAGRSRAPSWPHSSWRLRHPSSLLASSSSLSSLPLRPSSASAS